MKTQTQIKTYRELVEKHWGDLKRQYEFMDFWSAKEIAAMRRVAEEKALLEMEEIARQEEMEQNVKDLQTLSATLAQYL